MSLHNISHTGRAANERRRWLRTLAQNLVFFLLATISSSIFAGRPNIVFLLADDLGWAGVGYQNSEMRTPHLDALARSGVEFHRHYVMPACTPTRVALMTGRFPSRWGTHCTQASNDRALPPGTPTLASMLQSAGYETALIGKWHLGSKPEWGPNHYGFDYSYGSLAGAVGPFDHRYRLTRPEFTNTFHRNHQFISEAGHITDLTMREAVTWIEQPRQHPFFLYVPFNAVHVPLAEESRWTDSNRQIAAADRRLFAAAVSHMDHAIGQIVTALDRTGQRANTLVVFLSDNGGLTEHTGDKYPPPDPALHHPQANYPLRGEKGQTYEGGIRVPAIANWPGVLSRRCVTAPVHAVDWLPTLARLAQTRAPADLDGMDLWPVIAGGFRYLPSRNLYWVKDERRQWVALLRDGWKAIRREDQPWELYTVECDPRESNDLAKLQPERLHFLREQADYEWSRDAEDGKKRFDGMDLQGWITTAGQAVSPHGWRAAEGVIELQSVLPRPGNIITDRPFGNFRLSFEWKIAPGGNSGIKYRVQQYGGRWLGCEYQMLDDEGYAGPVQPQHTSGALYDLYPPSANKLLRPPNEFNTGAIVVCNNQIEHWLNGQLIVQATVGSVDWKRRVASSKFSNRLDFGRNRAGRIMLTDHYHAAWFRNFEFEPLP